MSVFHLTFGLLAEPRVWRGQCARAARYGHGARSNAHGRVGLDVAKEQHHPEVPWVANGGVHQWGYPNRFNRWMVDHGTALTKHGMMTAGFSHDGKLQMVEVRSREQAWTPLFGLGFHSKWC